LEIAKKPNDTMWGMRPAKSVKPVQPVKPVRPVKPVAPEDYEYYWVDD
jgi:hypothetical protein